MNTVTDIVFSLLETPFNVRGEGEKRDILLQGRPVYNLNMTSTKKSKKGNPYTIKFKTYWFSLHKWLCSSFKLQKLYCWPCLLFSTKHSIWISDGFSDLLNMSRGFHKHGDNGEHLRCEIIWKRNLEKYQNTFVSTLGENDRLFQLHYNENVRVNRLFLQTVIDTIVHLSKQGLAFGSQEKGKESESHGNFKELFALLISRGTLEVKKRYEKNKDVFAADSEIIQNELIQCISDYINDYVKKEIKYANFFSIQINDAADFNRTEQCSVILRFVNSDSILVERFGGFHDISEDRTSDALYTVLDNILEPFDYPRKLIGQSYDGAIVRSNHLNELQIKIQHKAPQALPVHCLSHHLNAVLQQSVSEISKCRFFFASLSGISACIKRIPTITETQWSSDYDLINVIVEEWDQLREEFKCIMNNQHLDKKSIQLAKTIFSDMNNFEFAFLAVVFKDVFRPIDPLFDTLQEKYLDIKYCMTKIQKVRKLVMHKKREEVFKALFEQANKMTDIKKYEFEYASCNHPTIYQYFKQLYWQISDHLLLEFDRRFQDCEKLQFVCLADTAKFDEFDSCFPSEALENFLEFYGEIFTKRQRLKNELLLVYDDMKFRNTSPQELLRMLHEDKDVFTEAYRLFALILTIPSTRACMDGNISCLERIKSYSRNTVSQERSDSLANISIQKDVLAMLMKIEPFYDDIIDRFAFLKPREIDLIYKQWKPSHNEADDIDKDVMMKTKVKRAEQEDENPRKKHDVVYVSTTCATSSSTLNVVYVSSTVKEEPILDEGELDFLSQISRPSTSGVTFSLANLNNGTESDS